MLEASVSKDDIDNWPEKAIQGNKNLMMEAASVGFAVLLEEMPEDRGTMAQEAIEPTWRDDRVVWGTTAPYALAQEKGTAPFTPPVKPLLEWGDRKFGNQSPSTSEVMRRIEKGAWGPDLFAHGGLAVWSKIREEGIEGKGFMEDSLEAAEGALQSGDPQEYMENELL